MTRFLKSWVINTAAVLVAVYIVPGIRFTDSSILTPLVTSLVLGVLNTFLRPVLIFLALPLVIFTLGLFMLVINAFLLYFVSFLLAPHFQVDSFGASFVGAVVISVVSLLLNFITGGTQGRVRFERRRPPPRSDDHDNGPVIDV